IMIGMRPVEAAAFINRILPGDALIVFHRLQTLCDSMASKADFDKAFEYLTVRSLTTLAFIIRARRILENLRAVPLAPDMTWTIDHTLIRRYVLPLGAPLPSRVFRNYMTLCCQRLTALTIPTSF